jgi:hypothetical protein
MNTDLMVYVCECWSMFLGGGIRRMFRRTVFAQSRLGVSVMYESVSRVLQLPDEMFCTFRRWHKPQALTLDLGCGNIAANSKPRASAQDTIPA